MTLKRARAKRRPPGVGCRQSGRKSCRRDAVTTLDGVRLCALHAADRLFAAHIRESGPCFAEGYRFGCNGGLQCAHVITRARAAIRWSDDNARPLCAGHHVWFTHNPNAWRAFVADNGIDYDALHRRAFDERPVNPLTVLERFGAAA